MAIRLSLKTHDTKKLPNGSQVVVSAKPYVRLVSGGGDPPIFVQGGHFFTEGGPELKDVPDWVQEELEKLTPVVRKEVGLS